MARSQKLEQRFQQGLLANLAEHNTLRGLWAEEVVAFFLDGWGLSEPWVYYDLSTADGNKMSVKQSAGTNPKLSIKGQDAAVIPKGERTASDDGWRYPASGNREYLSDVYTFAWLPGDLTQERVLNPEEWRFVVLSRAAMYLDLPTPGASSISAKRLEREFGPSLTGSELQAAVDRALADRRRKGVPSLRLVRG